MSDPESFVSFADYLGLQGDVGEQMFDRTRGDKSEQAAAEVWRAKNQQRTNSREGGSDASYTAIGDQATRGVASYSEFMAGMADPAKRQALMEKTYGKGGVSWLDSTLAGANSRASEGAADARRLGTQLESNTIDADRRRGNYAAQTAAQAKEDARGAAEQAANRDRLAKIAENNAERMRWKQINDYEDKFRQKNDSTDRYDHYVPGRLGTNGKPLTAAEYKAGKAKSAYGFGGAGWLKTSSGGDI